MIARRRLPTVAAAALLAGTLAGCHAPPPPPPPPPPLPVPPAFVSPPPEVVSGRWSFAITDTACVAHASNPDVSLALRIGHDKRVELSVAGRKVRNAVTHGGWRARLRFEGAAGSWTLPARSSAQRAVVAVVPLNETTAKQVLVLLGGGRLRTEVGRAYIPVLRLTGSDVAGRDWFDCVRSELGDTASGS
jgi:hypothetical protein